MQLKVEIRHMFFSNIYNGKKESKKIVRRIKDRENEKNGEISFLLEGTYYRGWEVILYAFQIVSINEY